MIRGLQIPLALALGGLWAFSGVEKILLLAQGDPLPLYLHEFGSLLIGLVSTAECFVSVLLFAGRIKYASLLGMALLSLFTVVLIVHPPHMGGCGCFGLSNAPWLDQIPPVGRNAVLLALHVLLFSVYSTKEPHQTGLAGVELKSGDSQSGAGGQFKIT